LSSFKLKVLLLGGPDSQKSELMHKFIKNRFAANYKLTVGVDILTKEVEFKPQEVATLSIWDVGSQQRFEFIRSTFYKGAAGAIIVFNLNRNTSLTQVASLIANLRRHAGSNIPICLIGNNIYSMEKDQEMEQEIQHLADNEDMIYIETSPSSGKYIEEMFVGLAIKIIESRSQ
jgi:small GTP-binding protein